MKPKMQKLLQNMQRYNSSELAWEVFGLDKTICYDALVVAPGWKPAKILHDPSWSYRELAAQSYVSGHLVERDGLKIGWIQCASGACNLIDHLSICGELNFKKLIFLGAVGSLSPAFKVGDFCTPTYSVAGVFANAYLCDKLSDYRPFEKVYPDMSYVNHIVELAATNGYELKPASVYCTDSISMEYSHLEEIRAFHTDLIEMETSSFYLLADLLEASAIALLAVSDNSATGDPLIGRDEDRTAAFNRCRSQIIPEMIWHIAKEP